MQEGSRRPIKTRSAAWARALAGGLANKGVTPNAISGLSVVFAAAGSAAFVGAAEGWIPWVVAWLLGAACVQLRLLCNLFDGMVAIEGGRKSAAGDLWNEIPDRFADTLLLLGAAWGAGMPWLGALAAWGAVMTAYVRETGAALGVGHDFCGPFAKPQRMAALTVGALICAFDSLPDGNPRVMQLALIVVAAGTGWTVGRRILRLAATLRRTIS